MIKDKYELVSKAERDRIIGSSFIPSYGALPVHNVKFNKLVQYLERMNNNLQVSNPSDYQKSIQDTIKMQLNLSRLKILNDYALKEKKEGGAGSSVLTALAFRNWCGAGTPIYDNIKNDLDDPNNMFKIDRICRDHDIRYTKAKTYEEMIKADNMMIGDIFNEYVLNFNKNFITGNYKYDFTTWSSSFYTVFNYLMTVIETGYTGYIIYKTAKPGYEILRYPYDYIKTAYPLQDYPLGYFNDIPQMLAAARDAENAGNPVIEATVAQFQNLFRDRPNRLISPQLNTLKMRLNQNLRTVGFSFLASTLVRDKIAALASLVAIGLKKGYETLTGNNLVKLTEHDVSDEDLENMIKVFENLQNQYLQESNLKPIKIGDEWLNVAIEIPPIQKLNKDIQIIIEQNKAYNELNKTMMETQPMPPAPVLEPETTEVYDDDDEPLTEEELERYNRYNKSYKNMVKLFSEINVEKDTFQRPYPDLPSTEMISGYTERPIVPDIEKDIEDAKQSSMLDIPDVEDETIEENNETGQDLKPDEIKNKMEL